jgi:hypothetical protein
MIIPNGIILESISMNEIYTPTFVAPPSNKSAPGSAKNDNNGGMRTERVR